MKLPLALVEQDGHIWIMCTHPHCMNVQDHRGYLYRLDAGQHAQNGDKLHQAIHHTTTLHGVP